MVFIAILEVVFPVFALTLTGYLWVRRDWGFDIAFVTRLALEFSIPCLVFQKFAATRFEADIFWKLAGATTALFMATTLIFAIILRLRGLSARALLLPLVSCNSGNVGLPLCLFAFGEQGLVYGIVIFSTTVVLQFTVGLWWVSGEASPLRVLRHPLVIASVLGAAFSWAEIGLPSVIDRTLGLAGQPAIPLMLMALGASIATLPALAPTRAIILASFKLVLALVLGIAIAAALGLTDIARNVFILQAITPVAVTTYMLAERYDRSPGDVAQLVMVSTILFALALPFILYVML